MFGSYVAPLCTGSDTHFSGKWLGSRQIRCNWATKGAGTIDDKQSSDAKNVVELTNGSSGESRVNNLK